jgi:phosphoglycerate dehydrogenase-like enzyme
LTERFIGVCDLPFDERQKLQLLDTATKYGLTVKLFNQQEFNPKELARCEVLCGNFSPESVSAATALRWFHSDWAGVEEYTSHPAILSGQVTLTNSTGAFGTMIAEYLLMGALMLLRHAPTYLMSQRRHIWHDLVPASTFFGKRVTVIGTGDTGGSFARLAQALGAHIIGCNHSGSYKLDLFEKVYSTRQINDALKDAEIVALCLPATAATEGLIGAHQLSQLAPGAILLNSGRGSTLDLDALVKALLNGDLGGAMLDVLPNEPLEESSVLWDVPNLLITPHISGSGSDHFNAEILLTIFCDNIRRYAEHEPLQNVVNPKRGY